MILGPKGISNLYDTRIIPYFMYRDILKRGADSVSRPINTHVSEYIQLFKLDVFVCLKYLLTVISNSRYLEHPKILDQ